MRSTCVSFHLVTGIILTALLHGCTASPQPSTGKYDYPNARTSDQVEVYHGVEVADPYRWLEDPDSAESRAWIDAENKLTLSYLNDIPERDRIKERMTELWNYERFGLPYKKGGRYFYSRNDGLQNQSVLYVMNALNSSPRVLLDPNTLSEDGTVALSGYAVSEDGKYLAYGISDAGSDWKEWKVRDIETGQDLEDHLKWLKWTGPAWTKDGKGFYYARYDEPKEESQLRAANYYQKLYYHRIGTHQEEDTLVYERPDKKKWGFTAGVTDDGHYLIISVSQGTLNKNLVFYADLTKDDFKVVELISDFEAMYALIDNDGPVFWFLTDDGAPQNRLIAIDIRTPDKAHWKEIIPEQQAKLQYVDAVGDSFIAQYLKDVQSLVFVYGMDGRQLRQVELPKMVSVSGFGGKRDDPETFYSYTGYTAPSTIYRYDVITDKSELFRRPQVDFDPTLYETRQVFYESKDGTRIPMSITHRKGLEPSGDLPTFLYGYGGFNISIMPRFSVSAVVWMEMGGVYAVANIRGGGEYGKEWHESGSKLHKQNCFDDFIAAAQWLIDNDYTNPSKLAIGGRSNGGLLVGACMTQRPDLFGAALPGVGVLDMLRFHKFTIGWAWTSDYGCADDPEEFKTLIKYSPLHNLKPGTSYPATLIATADHDDRVVPAHSFKFAATLQKCQTGDAPTLIRIQTRAGHGAGMPTKMRIEEAANNWAFLVRTLNMDVDW